MTATGGFAIAAGHHRATVGISGNSRARPLRSPRPSLFFARSDLHTVPGGGFAIPPASGPGRCRLCRVNREHPAAVHPALLDLHGHTMPFSAPPSCAIPARQPHAQSQETVCVSGATPEIRGCHGTGYAPARPTHKASDPGTGKPPAKLQEPSGWGVCSWSNPNSSRASGFDRNPSRSCSMASFAPASELNFCIMRRPSSSARRSFSLRCSSRVCFLTVASLFFSAFRSFFCCSSSFFSSAASRASSLSVFGIFSP